MEIIFLVGIFKKANLNVSFHIDKNLTFQAPKSSRTLKQSS